MNHHAFIRNGKLEHIKSKDVGVGDILAVKSKEKFPCDLVLLATSSLQVSVHLYCREPVVMSLYSTVQCTHVLYRTGYHKSVHYSTVYTCTEPVISSSLQGKCYVMTASLDGESNLKPKLALRETRKYMNVSFLKNISGHVECQNPSPDLFSFSGAATIVKDYGIEKCPIGIENLGMRGTQLRNTDYILGVAVYTGQDTKMSQNSKINANKFSSVERILNFCFILYLVLLLSEVVLCLALGAVYGLEAEAEAGGRQSGHWYLASRGRSGETLVSDGVSYLILFR